VGLETLVWVKKTRGVCLQANVERLLRKLLLLFQEFSVDFFQPLIRLLSAVKPFVGTGVIARQFLARKMVDILGLFCQKLRREHAQEVMAPLLQQFFSCFDGIYALRTDHGGTSFVARKYSLLSKSLENNSPLAAAVTSSMTAPQPVKKKKNTQIESDSYGSASSRISKALTIEEVLERDSEGESDTDIAKFADIYDTFSPSLAYHAYVLFCRVLGKFVIVSRLKIYVLYIICNTHRTLKNVV